MYKQSTLIAIGMMCFLTGTVSGHHAVNMNYDMRSEVIVTGKLVKLDFRNPHSQIAFNVMKEDGSEAL